MPFSCCTEEDLATWKEALHLAVLPHRWIAGTLAPADDLHILG